MADSFPHGHEAEKRGLVEIRKDLQGGGPSVQHVRRRSRDARGRGRRQTITHLEEHLDGEFPEASSPVWIHRSWRGRWRRSVPALPCWFAVRGGLCGAEESWSVGRHARVMWMKSTCTREPTSRDLEATPGNARFPSLPPAAPLASLSLPPLHSLSSMPRKKAVAAASPAPAAAAAVPDTDTDGIDNFDLPKSVGTRLPLPPSPSPSFPLFLLTHLPPPVTKLAKANVRTPPRTRRR